FKYFEYKYSIYSLLCDAVALAGAHFVACLKLCFCLYHLLLFKMRIAASLYKAFEPEEAKRILDKLEFHYTPKHGSWLNMAEIELSVLNRQCLERRIPDMDSLKQEIKAWEENRNEKSNSVDWRFTTADARIKLKKLYPIPQFKLDRLLADRTSSEKVIAVT
ncbi:MULTISPECIES: transposase, partial [unclassified Microcystis]|uniref:transposase n=1 Tax=unclassified Microcystis TaxID=2643300 RepID=UPI0022C890A7